MLFQPIVLPCGLKLKNRIAKTAMEENMASISIHNAPSDDLISLYRTWAEGGAGLIISGHVMVDYQAMAAPATPCLAKTYASKTLYMEQFRSWIKASRLQETKFFLQLNHPGRQMPNTLGLSAKGPSAVAMNLGRLGAARFDTPRELREQEILEIIESFAESALLAESLGADGVQVHAAHGYLISQFLSPLTNVRQDQWGGTLANRARILFSIITRIRQLVKPSFAIAIKINSADFQRGGFAENDSLWVIDRLDALGVDLIEISGGSFESPVMSSGVPRPQSTQSRESYFLDFAERVPKTVKTPILVTGGISCRQTAIEVTASGNVLAGIATALALRPDLPDQWRREQDPRPKLVYARSWLLSGPIAAMVKTKQVNFSLSCIGSGKAPCPNVWPLYAFLWDLLRDYRQTKEWLARTR